MENSETIWRSIQGYEESYEVSDDGQVRSLDRVIHCSDGTTRNRKGKVLKPHQDPSGYLSVNLACCGKQVTRFIHVLVAEAFIPKPDYRVEVNHLDGDKTNNAVHNLEWMTHKENIQHAFKSGLHPIMSLEYLAEIAKKGAKVSAAKHSMPVLCETDGLAFVSQNAADRHYQYHLGTISECLKKKSKTFRGKTFRKLSPEEKDNYTLLS